MEVGILEKYFFLQIKLPDEKNQLFLERLPEVAGANIREHLESWDNAELSIFGNPELHLFHSIYHLSRDSFCKENRTYRLSWSA